MYAKRPFPIYVADNLHSLREIPMHIGINLPRRGDREGDAPMSAVRPGYKQTEVGVIPEEWGVEPLGRFMAFQNGFNADKAAYGRGTPFINVLEVITKTHLSPADIPGRVVVDAAALATFEVRRGDILFNRTSETQEEVALAAAYCSDEPVVFGGFVIRGRPDLRRLLGAYGGYGFRSPAVRAQLVARGQGAVRANVGQGDLRKVLAPLPPLPEQQAIAGALGDADALIEALEALIAKKRVLKQGAMQDLLTGQRRLPGFQGEWETKRIREMTACTSGGTPSTQVADFWGGDIPWMSSGELHLRQVWEVAGRITEVGLQNSAAKLIPANCVLIGLAGQGKTRGTVAINRIPLTTNQSIAAILPSPSYSPEFLYHNLFARYDELREISSGDGGRGGLNLTLIGLLEVPIPTLDEQRAIAAVLCDMDAGIAALEARLARTRDVKQGMMQALLTGEIRLV